MRVQSWLRWARSTSPTSPTRAAPGPTRPAPRWRCCAGATAPSCAGDWSMIGLAEDPPPLRRGGLHAGADDRRQHALPSLRDAVPGRASPAGSPPPRAPAGRSSPRGWLDPGREDAGAAGAAARLVHDHAGARRGRRHRDRRCDASRGWTRAGSSRRSTRQEHDRGLRGGQAETRTAEGGPTHFQGKARQTDGPVRYSAPSLVFEGADGRRLEAGGFQPVEAYDVLVANLDPTLERRAPAGRSAAGAARSSRCGLATQEVAAIMAHNNEAPDRDAAERRPDRAAGRRRGAPGPRSATTRSGWAA